MNILILEVDDAIRQTLELCVTSLRTDFMLYTTKDVREVRKYIETFDIDVIVLDYHSADYADLLKLTKEYFGLKTIFVTATSIRIGLVKYDTLFIKPYDVDDFCNELDKVKIA